jgi:hypothetical protein
VHGVHLQCSLANLSNLELKIQPKQYLGCLSLAFDPLEKVSVQDGKGISTSPFPHSGQDLEVQSSEVATVNLGNEKISKDLGPYSQHFIFFVTYELAQ